MREKEGDRYYHAASNACERIVTALCNNTLYLNEYMVRVRIYPVILYNLHTYLLLRTTTYCGNRFGSCLLSADHLAPFINW